MNCIFNSSQREPANLAEELASETYYATVSLYDRAARVANGILFAASAGAVFVLATGGSPLLVGASCICLALALRKVVQVALGYAAYPAAVISTLPAALVSKILPVVRRRGWKIPFEPHETGIAAHRQELLEYGFHVQSVRLVKGGVAYDACAVFMPGAENNKWRLRAFGNVWWYEHFLLESNQFEGFNTLFVNGPSVGRSGGFPTRYQLGAGFEAGLQYLEKVKRASHILLHGSSFGGGMLSEAILQHDWTQPHVENIRYLMVSERSFCRLSDASAELFCGRRTIWHRIAGVAVRALFWVSGQELDAFSASKKLERLQRPTQPITHIVIQNPEGDEIIKKEANLTSYSVDSGSGSCARGFSLSLSFLGSKQAIGNRLPRRTIDENMQHGGPLPDVSRNALHQSIAAFAAVVS